MKLSVWAKQQGISYRTAWNLFRAKKIKNAYRLASGTIIVADEIKRKSDEFIVTYARVSSSENKSNLNSQSQRLIDYCNAKGWCTDLNIKEVGSGLNDKRKKLESILVKGEITKLVVEHKDRLARFGVRYIEILCQHVGCELIILNKTENNKEDLIQDFVSVITSFCSRLYGQRRSKRNTEKLIKDLELENKKINQVHS